MRPAVLIIAANGAAFALGAVTTLWLTSTAPHGLHSAPQVMAAATVQKPAPGVPPVVAPAPKMVLSPAPAAAPLAVADAVGSEPPGASVSPPSPAASPLPAAMPVAVPQAPPPAAPAAVASSASPGARRGAYVLQLGAFLEPGNAGRMRAELKKYGYGADIVPFAGGNGKVLQLVQISGFADRSGASAAAVSLQRNTGIAALVMKPTSE